MYISLRIMHLIACHKFSDFGIHFLYIRLCPVHYFEAVCNYGIANVFIASMRFAELSSVLVMHGLYDSNFFIFYLVWLCRIPPLSLMPRFM